MLDVVIIGCGNIAGGYDNDNFSVQWPSTHAAAYVNNKWFSIVGCCDPDEDKAASFQKRWNIPVGAMSPEILFELGVRPDIVSICSPTDCHIKHLDIILKWHPKLVFCEKPIASNLADAELFVEKCELAGIKIIVNYTRRWAPDVIELKESIEQGKWGDIYSVYGVYNKGLLNNGSHLIDLVNYFLGPLQLISSGRKSFDFWTTDPSVPALLETKNKIPVMINIANASQYAFFELEIVTQRGVLRMEEGGKNWIFRLVDDSPINESPRILGAKRHEPGLYYQAMTLAIDNMYDVVVRSGKSPCTGHDALKVQRTCHQIKEASIN